MSVFLASSSEQPEKSLHACLSSPTLNAAVLPLFPHAPLLSPLLPPLPTTDHIAGRCLVAVRSVCSASTWPTWTWGRCHGPAQSAQWTLELCRPRRQTPQHTTAAATTTCGEQTRLRVLVMPAPAVLRKLLLVVLELALLLLLVLSTGRCTQQQVACSAATLRSRSQLSGRTMMTRQQTMKARNTARSATPTRSSVWRRRATGARICQRRRT